jgi:dihydroorotate dehydrogenase (fumarate)
MDITSNYMGLRLCTPLVASASPLTESLGNLRALEDHGAGAVVLPSLFAEQIDADTARHESLSAVGRGSSPEATGYLPQPGAYYVQAHQYLEQIRVASDALAIPVIASLNGSSNESWTNYAADLQAAGAAAIELNIYFIPSDIDISGRAVEERYLDIVRAVAGRITIPFAVKLNPYFSSLGSMARELVDAGASGLVLFNRFYQPDIDTVRLKIRHDLDLSRSQEMRLPLLWIAILHGRVQASLAASTGVHSADDVMKYLMAGADVVMTTSALLEHGVGHMRTLHNGLIHWLDSRDLEDLSRVRGMLSQKNVRNPEQYQRANYIKILQRREWHQVTPVVKTVQAAPAATSPKAA